jgi:hypothetical protein
MPATKDGKEIKSGETVYQFFIERYFRVARDVEPVGMIFNENSDPAYLERNCYSSPLAAKIAGGKHMIACITEDIARLESQLPKGS